MEDFAHVYVMNHGDCQKPPKTIHQCQVSASNPFICEIFRHIPYVDTLHFLRGSQKCFAGVSHNRSLIKSMKITLLLSGMQFVEFPTSVDAFDLWLFSLDGPNITQIEQIMAFIHSSTSCTSLWSLLERASPTCSVPLVPELHSSLKASPYSLGKKERDVDTFN